MGLPWGKASTSDPNFSLYLENLTEFEVKKHEHDTDTSLETPISPESAPSILKDDHVLISSPFPSAASTENHPSAAPLTDNRLSVPPATSAQSDSTASSPPSTLLRKSKAGPAATHSSRVSSAVPRPRAPSLTPISAISLRPRPIEEQTPKYRAFRSHDTATRKMLFKLFEPDPNKRPTVEDVLSMSIVKSIKCCVLDNEEEEQIQKVKRTGTFDASAKGGFKNVKVQAKHNHIPSKLLISMKMST